MQEDNEEDRSGTVGQRQEEQRDSDGDDGSDNDEEDGIEETMEGAVSDTPVSVVLQQVIIWPVCCQQIGSVVVIMLQINQLRLHWRSVDFYNFMTIIFLCLQFVLANPDLFDNGSSDDDDEFDTWEAFDLDTVRK